MTEIQQEPAAGVARPPRVGLARLRVPYRGGGRGWLPYGSLIVLVVGAVWMLTSGASADLFTYNTFLIYAIGAVALNYLMGTAGQVSIGNAAFLAIGAFGTAFFSRLGVPFPADILLAAVLSGVAGIIVGLPALRIRGIYLALATLAAHFIVVYAAGKYQDKAVGSLGFQFDQLFLDNGLDEQQEVWIVVLSVVTAVLIVLTAALRRGKAGRAARMVRDHEAAAAALGINVTATKLVVFTISSTIIGLSGGLLARLTGSVNVETFTFAIAVAYIAMIIIGGLDSDLGALLGALVVTWLPTLAGQVSDTVLPGSLDVSQAAQISQIVYGVLIIAFVLLSGNGIAGWLNTFRGWLTRRRTGPAGAAQRR